MANKEELKRFAENGDVEAQFRLGEYYDDGEKNVPEACKWYEKAAIQGHAESQFCLGYYYRFGDKGFPADIEKCRYWFGKAAEQGHTRAQRRLGDVYRSEQNFMEAVKWYNKAVEKKDKFAMFYLARLNEKPDAFPGADVNLAVKLYEELSDAPFNDKGAMVNLALLYCEGRYIPRNADRGKKLIERCNLFINGIVQLYDEIAVYELYRIGMLYCSGEINANNEPSPDDLSNGIKLLDIAIKDGLKGYHPENLVLAQKLRDISDKRRKNLIDLRTFQSQMQLLLSQ